MPLFAAILAFIGLTQSPGQPAPVPRRRRRVSRKFGATPAPDSVVPAALPRIDKSALAVPYVLPAATAVRVLLHAAGRTVQDAGLGGHGKTVADARESLGTDLVSYVDLCLSMGSPLPSQSIASERADDAAYRGRIRRACLADLTLWERVQARRDRERAEAVEDGRREPPCLHVPGFVLEALAARKAAQVAERAAREGAREGARAKNSIPKNPRQASPAGPQR